MITKDKTILTGAQELAEAFKELRDELISKNLITVTKFEQYVLDKEPDFNTDRGKQKIFNVYYGRATSLYLFWILEDYKLNN